MAGKLGQMLSARHDILSIELINHLSSLQSTYDIKSFSKKDLQLDKIPAGITDIDYRALKAGTICVVLNCKYKNQDAVLKFVKKGIPEKLASTFYWMLFFLWLIKYFDPCNLYERISELKKTFLQQTDLLIEAEHQQWWYDNYSDDNLGIPKILCLNSYAICMERIPNNNRIIKELNEDQQNKHALAIYRVVYDSIYITGRVHADLHPGNIIFDGTKFVFIDFGWCVFLDEEQRHQNILFGLALKSKDYKEISIRICKMYFTNSGDDLPGKLEPMLECANLCEQKHTATILSRVLGIFCMKYRLTLGAAGSATESAMMNIDGLLPNLFENVSVDEIRSQTLQNMKSKLMKEFLKMKH